MVKIRESNYDLLRIISAFAVIMLHVSGGFLVYNEEGIPTDCSLPVMLINHIVRFAVPCFLMLSGAFLLADERNADYNFFYKKSIRNIGITGAIFFLLYMMYRLAKFLLRVFVLHLDGTDTVFSIFKDTLRGRPSGHLWYLSVLIGLYLAVPFVIRLASNLQSGGVDLYGKITPVFLVLASLAYITSEHKLMWDVGYAFCFLGYFLMGYKIRKWGESHKGNGKAALLILSGFLVNAVLAYINYLRGLKDLPVDVSQLWKNPFSYAPLAPIEVIAACLVFAGFSVMKAKRDFSELSGCTFLIYLVHAGVIDVIFILMGDRLFGNPSIEAVVVVIISVIVFVISLLFAEVYGKLKRRFWKRR